MAAIATGLGYPGSENLVRTVEGICSASFQPSQFLTLCNYSTLVKVTRAAMEKIHRDFKSHSDCQRINISAVSSSGQSTSLFVINTNFFRRILNTKSEEPELTLEVGTFYFDPIDRLIVPYSGEGPLADALGFERSFKFFEERTLLQDVKEFKAELLSGYLFTNSTHLFASEYFENFPEVLALSMDVSKTGEWILNLQQKVGAPLAEEERDRLLAEKMNAVSRSTLKAYKETPISQALAEIFRHTHVIH